jgi:hypothetical protein
MGHADDHHAALLELNGWLFAGDVGNLKIFAGEDIYQQIEAAHENAIKTPTTFLSRMANP